MGIIRALSFIGWGYKRKKEQYAYLVVDMNKSRDYDGFLTHAEAYKADMFATLEEAKEYIDNDIAKSELKDVLIYKLVEWCGENKKL